MKRIITCLSLNILILFSFIFGMFSVDAAYEDYTITDYDIDIVVNENNTLDITENITANFRIAKHGIFRKIPLSNTVTRLDGTSSSNRARVTNLSVDNKYTTSRADGYLEIKIGDADKTITGKKSYVVKYTYDLGKDPLDDYDELYFNLIGAEWDTTISNITFNITMPKEFDNTLLGFSSGKVGSTDNENILYYTYDNKIVGSYKGTLPAYSALTVRCELPEGYFVGAGHQITSKDYLILALPVVFLIISVLLWYVYGRDERVVETVEFYPPEGLNSLDLGFTYKGRADNKDVTSLLVYLANKGYIKITETEEKTLLTISKGFKITKLKEYDGENEHEKSFLEGLFKCQSTKSKNEDPSMVSSFDLTNSFYKTMNSIISKVNNSKNRNKIFDKKASSKLTLVKIMIFITYLLITVPMLLYNGDYDLIPVALIFPGIGFTVLGVGIIEFIKSLFKGIKETITSLFIFIFMLIWGAGFGFVPWSFTVLPVLREEPFYLIGYIIGIICIFGMIACHKFLPKRTRYGTEMLGKINGFKNFLVTAEKEKLEAMVMDNPNYFYNILPYTYVLGVSDKWIKKFESISVEPPSWYDSPNAFDMITFGTFMNTTMASAQSAMSSSPSSNSSGGSSGGGFSGGGSGGGGGGSW